MVGERGFSLVEVAIAIVIVAIIGSVAFTGDARQLQHVAESFAETKASRLASGRIERLRAEPRALEVGTSEFRADGALPGGVGFQHIRRIEAGLFEVEVEVRWLPAGATKRRRFTLTTWMEQEDRR